MTEDQAVSELWVQAVPAAVSPSSGARLLNSGCPTREIVFKMESHVKAGAL